MAPSEADALAPVVLGSADVLAGVSLSAAAGWNQTADDWQLFVGRGGTHGLRSARSELVATAATLPYTGGQGWISMVLVHQDWQRRGLASRLMAACVERLADARLMPVLDATPAGEAVYTQLGFRRGFGFERWEGDIAGAMPRAGRAPLAPPGLRPADLHDLDAIAALDTEATGLDRRFLLRGFLARHGTAAWVAEDAQGRPQGFALARRGRRATQIGPLVAQGAQQALALLQAAFARLRGPVFLDVPTGRDALAGWLAERQLRVQRGFARMALAKRLPARITQADARVFALAGPEFG